MFAPSLDAAESAAVRQVIGQGMRAAITGEDPASPLLHLLPSHPSFAPGHDLRIPGITLVYSPAIMQRDPNQAPTSVNPATEKHYRVQELVKLWGLSDWTIRRMFQNEPGSRASVCRNICGVAFETLTTSASSFSFPPDRRLRCFSSTLISASTNNRCRREPHLLARVCRSPSPVQKK